MRAMQKGLNTSVGQLPLNAKLWEGVEGLAHTASGNLRKWLTWLTYKYPNWGCLQLNATVSFELQIVPKTPNVIKVK